MKKHLTSHEGGLKEIDTANFKKTKPIYVFTVVFILDDIIPK